MTNKDFFLALDALEQEKGISKEYFLDALKSALTTAYKRNFGEVRPVDVEIKPEKYSIEMYAYQTIVAEVENPDAEIALIDVTQIADKSKKILRFLASKSVWRRI